MNDLSQYHPQVRRSVQSMLDNPRVYGVLTTEEALAATLEWVNGMDEAQRRFFGFTSGTGYYSLGGGHGFYAVSAG